MREHFAEGVGRRGRTLRDAWMKRFEEYKAAYPKEADFLFRMQHRQLPEGWDADIPVFPTDAKGVASIVPGKKTGEKMMAKPVGGDSAYDLESAVALDFNAILKAAAKEDEPSVEKMAVMSKEEIEAMRMMEERNKQNPRMRYVERYVEVEIDDNPKFDSAIRMAASDA